MKKIALILAGIATLLSFDLSARDEYRGMISSTIVEPNGNVYMGDEGFTNGGVFTDKQVIYFYQERGQKLTMTKQNIVFDTSRDKKYHMMLELIERTGEKFRAKVSFYQNAMSDVSSVNATPNNTTSGSTALISKVIKSVEIDGLLNSDNRYTFIDDHKANFKLSINIDRTFSEEEIRERLNAQLQNQIKTAMSLQD